MQLLFKFKHKVVLNQVDHSVRTICFRYGDLAGAAPQPDGLAVLGVLFEMASEDNPKFGPMLEACKRIEEPSSAEVTGILEL